MAETESLVNTREQIGREYGEVAQGPYITISRQCGCSGFTLALLLAEVLNDDAPPGRAWKVFGREVLEQLATETNLATELVEKIRAKQPRLVLDFFRSFLGKNVPSGYEIRNRITTIIRGMAFDGYVIIVGQGGSGATTGIDNGLHIRLEAPEDWRAVEVAKSQGCSLPSALAIIRKREKEREYLRRIYHMRFPREPQFHLVYDQSCFGLTTIAKHMILAMRMKHLI
ncbi:MAG: cytidylate kinase-like family protein [Planctomycetota bacterium]|nr:cytidylate kinase-like family protein [Planctomycetota bacterium]